MFFLRLLIITLANLTLAHSIKHLSLSKNLFFPSTNELETVKLIKGNNYPVEVHEIITEDGYILTTFRIPYGTKNKDSKKPVIILHGVLCDSDCWAVIPPEKGLIYLLADEGYDVWIPNARGTTYSLQHTNLTIEDERFWDFSVHELGYYDLPGVIDYVLEKTKCEKLALIGHSQGVTQCFIMASSRPEYNQKVQIMAALGPVIHIDNSKGPAKIFDAFTKLLAPIAKLLHIHSIFNHSDLLQYLGTFCSKRNVVGFICDEFIFSMIGADFPQTNQTIVGVISAYCPAGASVKQIIHYGQFTRGKFANFDYGVIGNLKRYNMTSPPEYNISKIIAPVAIYHGANDLISTPLEVIRLSEELPNLIERTLIDDLSFNHLDFVWAINVKPLLNDKIINLLNRYM